MSLDLIIDARPADIGAFSVARLLPYHKRRMVGPFIFLDHAGPVSIPGVIPRSMDVLPHPHIGLATVTYLFSGEMTHRDSTGVEQVIRPGDVNWMMAGRGISHSERFEDPFRRTGGEMALLQSWVALPEEIEEQAPTFAHVDRSQLPTFDDAGVRGVVVAGRAFGASSPVVTQSPLFYVHVELDAGGAIDLPSEYGERAAYVVRGSVEHEGMTHPSGRMLVFAPGALASVRALESSTLMLLGGEPLGPRHIWWNFVSSRKERIEQAKADWQAGRIALPINDTKESIPLPGSERAQAEPMS